MEVLTHHIYEYKKGLRNLVLHTTDAMLEDVVISRLEKHEIPYIIEKVGEKSINIFFGNSICIDVLKYIKTSDLSTLSDEEDFMLGIMLGYDRLKQCERYVGRKNGKLNLTLRQELVG